MAEILKFECKTKNTIGIQESYIRSEKLNERLLTVTTKMRWLKSNGIQPNDKLAEEYIDLIVAMSMEDDFRDSLFQKKERYNCHYSF